MADEWCHWKDFREGELPRVEASIGLWSPSLEALANAFIGILLAQGVLWLFDVPFERALGLNAVMFVVSYGRSFLIRLVFERLGDPGG